MLEKTLGASVRARSAPVMRSFVQISGDRVRSDRKTSRRASGETSHALSLPPASVTCFGSSDASPRFASTFTLHNVSLREALMKTIRPPGPAEASPSPTPKVSRSTGPLAFHVFGSIQRSDPDIESIRWMHSDEHEVFTISRPHWLCSRREVRHELPRLAAING